MVRVKVRTDEEDRPRVSEERAPESTSTQVDFIAAESFAELKIKDELSCTCGGCCRAGQAEKGELNVAAWQQAINLIPWTEVGATLTPDEASINMVTTRRGVRLGDAQGPDPLPDEFQSSQNPKVNPEPGTSSAVQSETQRKLQPRRNNTCPEAGVFHLRNYEKTQGRQGFASDHRLAGGN
ncbi:hypothetical protein ACF0H5_010140 [Mactra antiquata]